MSCGYRITDFPPKGRGKGEDKRKAKNMMTLRKQNLKIKWKQSIWAISDFLRKLVNFFRILSQSSVKITSWVIRWHWQQWHAGGLAVLLEGGSHVPQELCCSATVTEIMVIHHFPAEASTEPPPSKNHWWCSQTTERHFHLVLVLPGISAEKKFF